MSPHLCGGIIRWGVIITFVFRTRVKFTHDIYEYGKNIREGSNVIINFRSINDGN
jgi:hypothetical protein